jgi:hypothetical protein
MNFLGENPFNFCDELYCMGLKENLYRRERVEVQFKNMDLKVTFVDAIKNWARPRKGCLQTHQKIIKTAKEKGQKNIFIFEDDVKFLYPKEKTWQILSEALKALPDAYNALYIGIRWGTQGEEMSKNLVEIHSGKSTHAVMFSHVVFDKILEYDGKNFDHCMLDTIQKYRQCYCVQPELAVQNG